MRISLVFEPQQLISNRTMSKNSILEHQCLENAIKTGNINSLKIIYSQELAARLMQLTQRQDYLQLVFQSISCLALLTPLHRDHELVHIRVSMFVKMLDHSHPYIVQSALQGLENILRTHRSIFISISEIIRKILSIIEKGPLKNSLKNKFYTALAKLSYYESHKIPNQQIIFRFCDVILNKHLFYRSTLYHCCFSLAGSLEYCEDNTRKIRAIFENGAIQRIITFLQVKDRRLKTCSFKILLSVTRQNQQFTNQLISLGLLDLISQFSLQQMEYHAYQIRRIILSICSWGEKQKYLLLNVRLLQKLSYLSNYRQFQIVCILVQLINIGDPQILFHIYKKYKLIKCLCTSLIYCQQDIILALANMLELGEMFKENGRNVFLEMFRSERGSNVLRLLLASRDETIASIIYARLQKFMKC